MRHRHRSGKLHVSPSHQKAMQRNVVAALLQHGEIVTTVPKAKAFRPFAERLITLARDGNRRKALGTPQGKAQYLHAVRHAASLLPHRPTVRRLFEVVAPAVGDRPGGYTRIIRLGQRRLGDAAPKAMLMLVDKPAPPPEAAEPAEKAKQEKAPKQEKARGKGRKAAAGAEASASS